MYEAMIAAHAISHNSGGRKPVEFPRSITPHAGTAAAPHATERITQQAQSRRAQPVADKPERHKRHHPSRRVVGQIRLVNNADRRACPNPNRSPRDGRSGRKARRPRSTRLAENA